MPHLVHTPFGDLRVPEGTRIVLMLVDVPHPQSPLLGASAPVTPISSAASALDGTVRGTSERTGAAPVDQAVPSALAAVRSIRNARGNVCLKRAEWAKQTGLSIRELKRATKVGAVESHPKPDGRDNKAIVIAAEALEAYLADVEAVRRGAKGAPAWWDDVHGAKSTPAVQPNAVGEASTPNARTTRRRS